MATSGRKILKPWVLDALRQLGGEARIGAVTQEIWRVHEREIAADGALLSTWQYEARWSANELRREGALAPADATPRGVWALAS